MSDLSESLPSQPATIRRGGGRKWIHPAPTKGRYTRLRLVASAVLLLVFYATPWITVDGQPFLRLSFLRTSFVMFGSPILIYEFYRFVLLALWLVVTLFLASSLYGRIWCGYACPQTVFVEQIFGRIETLFEGNAAKRIVTEGKPLTAARVLRKIGKQLAFGLVSASFAFTVVAVFTGPEALLRDPSRGGVVAFGLLTALAWFDGAYWREQFCHIVCPYGRFQGVMQDPATRTVGYDQSRGEPRRRGKDRAGAGDCIDCGLCVRVCPSGIDIRQGAHQLECIACAKCIDACDGVMSSVSKPQGLIRYDAVAMFGEKRPAARPRMLRPRLAVYAAVWLALLGVGIHDFRNRAAFHATLLSVKGAAPYVLEGDRIKNIFTVKIGNQTGRAASYTLALSDAAAGGMRIESPTALGPVAAGEEGTFPVLVSAARAASGQTVGLTVQAVGTAATRSLSRIMVGPQARASDDRDDRDGSDHAVD